MALVGSIKKALFLPESISDKYIPLSNPSILVSDLIRIGADQDYVNWLSTNNGYSILGPIVLRVMPSSAAWSSVTYGNGRFVAVANGTTAAAYSTDGIKWTAARMPSSASLS